MSERVPNAEEALTELAAEPRRRLTGELWDLLKHNKKWWLGPIILVILALGMLVALGGTAVAPFIYTIF